MIPIKFKKLKNFDNLPLPEYATTGSAGLDLCAAIENDVVLKPGERCLIPTGLAIALPSGYEAQIRPRSGLALKHGITVLNSPGTIDSDYRGEICIILANINNEDFHITRGMRIAQMVIASVAKAVIEVVDDLDDTARNVGGFGSTGIKAKIPC